jgi:hypothetical protein
MGRGKGTELLDAMIDQKGPVCANHEGLVEVLKGMDRRLRRVEIIGIILVLGTAGSLGREWLVALLVKMAGG